MKAIDAASAVPRASQPGPKSARAAIPIAAHPICATNILYFFAAGVVGVAKRTAHTAPKGAMVKVSPMGSTNLSRYDMASIAMKAPEAGHTMSLIGGEGETEESELGEDAADAAEEAKIRARRRRACRNVLGEA